MEAENRTSIQFPEQRQFTGQRDMDVTVKPGRRFKLLYIRCHFSVPHGETTPDLTALSNMSVTLSSGGGTQFDVQLFAIQQAGLGRDVNSIIASHESNDPSPWSFDSNDALVFKWPNPDGVVWGLTVGIVPA